MLILRGEVEDGRDECLQSDAHLEDIHLLDTIYR